MIKTIDFGQLYREHLARSGRVFKTPEDWDKKAADMRTKVLDSSYRTDFVSRMQYDAEDTVLDVGLWPWHHWFGLSATGKTGLRLGLQPRYARCHDGQCS